MIFPTLTSILGTTGD